MNKKQICYFFALLLIFVSFKPVSAQDTSKAVSTLPKPIVKPKFSEVVKAYADSLQTERLKSNRAQAKLDSQNKVIEALKIQADSRNLRVKDSVVAKNVIVDAVDVMGSTMPLSTYNYIVWGIVAALAIALFVVISMSAKHRNEAKYRIGLHEELTEEFQKYKVKTNEKEKKLARELQTERNKIDELMGRG